MVEKYEPNFGYTLMEGKTFVRLPQNSNTWLNNIDNSHLQW